MTETAALVLFCDCLVALWLMVVTEPDRGDDDPRDTCEETW